jgi:hypothetical protein
MSYGSVCVSSPCTNTVPVAHEFIQVFVDSDIEKRAKGINPPDQIVKVVAVEVKIPFSIRLELGRHLLRGPICVRGSMQEKERRRFLHREIETKKSVAVAHLVWQHKGPAILDCCGETLAQG